MANPDGNVGYMLVQKTNADLIVQKYPGAADGSVPGLTPVVSNDRYSLLEVTGPQDTGTVADEPATSSSSSAPPTSP